MASVIRLLVLGVFRKHGGTTHGYAVHRQLAEWKVETWTSVKVGSIYHALKQLTKEGKLRAIATEESPEGPGRTIYELTENGEAEFFVLLEQALSSFDLEQLGAGVAFMEELRLERVVELLKGSLKRARKNRELLDGLAPTVANRSDPPHTKDLLELWSGHLSATASWTTDLIRRLEVGEYQFRDENPPN